MDAIALKVKQECAAKEREQTKEHAAKAPVRTTNKAKVA
jgi:hypothetical protein